ncbi:YciI-like protein [Aureimonas frigidaquae]|uniref:YciI-like protein n=1 Tax=Aureimonas frigidaquae TaxID=424757 RepID=UPI000783E4D1|nr:YciI-like protein [Aureimonas frigidaquae]
MLYAIICNDRPDAGTLRMDTRPAHVDYLKSLGDTLKLAGPFLADEKPDGSLLVVEAADEAAARALAENDPYAKAGLFANTTIRRWNWVFNNPEAR